MASDNVHIESVSPVTSIIVQKPIKAHMREYEAWLKEIVPTAQTFPGHRGVNVIRPHGQGGEYTVVLHFADRESLQAWLDSDTRKRLIAKVRPFLHADEKIDIHPGIEYWFTPAQAGRAAAPWKQFLVTLSVIFPLSLLVPWLLSLAAAGLPALDILVLPVLRQFIATAIIVALITFLIMPRYVRLISRWLYR